ncbi:helix-turn-helix domain-containing protein [Hymenobacter ruricola]|uniref:AraC family transcriptional regulator n=1 Tax=Hymenobacter ruricola TaxID=2791023 RepID=A0ABS0I4U4_9BACT|nr:helix-turn-helix domain-containing protein [Hymenobacter ruricola]MBF9221981.1 AraC family transcriptional regulator [Hymenobacter ruricola]
MQPFLNLWSVWMLLGAAQGFFLSGTFLFSTQGARLSNRLLGAITFSLALLTTEILLCYSGYIRYAPFFVSLTEPLTFVVSPLLLLYARSLTEPAFRWRPRYWLLGLPAVAHAIYLIPFFAQSNAWKLRTVAESFHQPHPAAPEAMRNFWWFATYKQFYPVFHLVLGAYLLLYVGLQLHTLRRYRRHRAARPTGQAPALSWLNGLGVSFGLLLLVYVGATTYYRRQTGDVNDAGDVYVGALISLLFYGMSGNAIRQSSLLALSTPEEAPAEAAAPRRKYEKTALSPEASTEILSRLRTLMVAGQPYRNPDLSLTELAGQLRVPTHHLSQVINEQCQQNFFDFINTYRIEEVKRQLQLPETSHLKLEEIGFAAGFNSKSAFNAAFKKNTDTTPSQFRKNSLAQ